MDEHQEKPFDIVSIVILVLIAATSDVSDLFTAFIAPVPVIGQIVYFFNSMLISPIIWIIIQGWFIMKVGLSGRKGLITGVSNLFGGLGNIANLPGSETIMTTIAILAANHMGAVSALAGAKSGGTAALAKQPKVALAGASTGGKQRTGVAIAGAGRGAIPSAQVATAGEAEAETTAAPRPELAPPEVSEEALGVKKEPLERLKEVMEQIPEPEQIKEEET